MSHSPWCDIFAGQLARTFTLDIDTTTINRWTFQLVDGVPFHDNWGQFTAADILHSAIMLSQEDSTLAYANDWRTVDLEASQIVSDTEVIIQLKNPNPDFLFYIAPSGGGLIMSKAFWDARAWRATTAI